MKVKICGITNLSDAVCACEAGADYLGLAFYPKSPRYITYQNAARLIHQLQQEGWTKATGPNLVGIFVEESTEALNTAAAEIGVHTLQLHGEYRVKDLQSLDFPYFVAISPQSSEMAKVESQRYFNRNVGPGPSLLVDAHVPGLWGGSGQIGNWKLAAQICQDHPGTLLAGGLTPHNVGAAIQEVQPWGVDVSGGVEASKGIKDHQAVRAFISQANQNETATPLHTTSED